MVEFRISITLPYALQLEEGEYLTVPGGEGIAVSAPPGDTPRPQTAISAAFQRGDIPDPDERHKARAQDADRLLRRTNRLLRWYRAAGRQADVTELTRALASPFLFEAVSPGDLAGWLDPIIYEESAPEPHDLATGQITAAVRDGLAGGADPRVDILFLLDAERAVLQGRFREAVLFCWSTIDSVFNRKFDALVDAALGEEWGQARDFFKGFDFGLRNKMTAGMRFVANRSLFAEPDNFWDRLSSSYAKRNAIIHRGENASEDEARAAIQVAEAVVRIMNSVPAPD